MSESSQVSQVQDGNGVVWWALLGGFVISLVAIVAEAVRLLGTMAHSDTISYAPFWWRVGVAAFSFLLLYGWEKRKGIS